jgi:diguanylate cyclase
MGVLVVLVVVSMLWSAFWLVRVFDARTQAQLVAHQTLEADLWARMLSARMEAHQRLLSSIAQGVHTSLLDKPEVLDALMQQDGSMLRLFESLHVALPSGSISHHGALGQSAEIDGPGMDALRRTLSEGKPTVSMVQSTEDSQHLRVLLTVPIRRAEGSVSGALAALVKLPLAALLPETVAPEEGLQYMLLDSQGLVLAHSDATQRWKNVQDLVGAHGREWQALSRPSTANADTQIWPHTLATRVGLPLPQWQVVVLRDLSLDMLWQQRLPPKVWAALGLGALVLTLLVGGVLWGWLAPWPKKPRSMGQGLLATSGSGAEEEALADGEAMPHDLTPHSGVMAMFEAVPSSMFLEVDGRVTMATPQVGIMLGYLGADAEALTMPRLFDDADALSQVRSTLADLGSFEGSVQLRKKDGDVVQVLALAWTPSQMPSATVWRLRLPWRQRRATPLPEQEHAWRDELTGLPTREAFIWGLQSWMTESVHTGKAVQSPSRLPWAGQPMQGCLLFADLDHLGLMNEVTAREMGNKVLRHVGRLLANYTQPLGNVARLGGDEFAVLLPGISLAHAQGIGQALCDAVWRWQPSWGGERHWVSISIGIVAVDAHRHTPQQALRAADMACYEAKRRGRCQVAAGAISAQPSMEV